MGIDISRLSPKAQLQIMSKLLAEGMKPEKTEKYRNEPTVSKGIRFQSRKEARRYEKLLLLLMTEEIKNLRIQQDFTLQEAYTTSEGLRVRAIRYKADFAYERPTAPDAFGTIYWVRVVEDVKSRPTRTKDYILKRKMMQDKLGITIQEV